MTLTRPRPQRVRSEEAPPDAVHVPVEAAPVEAAPVEAAPVEAVHGPPWVVFALEDVLLDTRPPIVSVIRTLSGATLADIQAFEATGDFDDPWQLARAACAWIRAGRPASIPRGGWRVVVNQCGGDPGDLSRRAQALWRERAPREELPRMDADRLRSLGAVARLAVCTRRDRADLAQAEALLGVRFDAATTAEDGLRPDPQVLLRLSPSGHFVGRGDIDRACAEGARFVFHAAGEDLTRVVDRMLAEWRVVGPTG